MRKILLKNIKATLIYFGALLLSIFVTEKSGKPYIFGYIFKSSLIVFFLVSVYINRNSFMNVKKIYLRYFLIAILCIALTLLLGYIGLIIAVNFNLSIGGSL
jgi:hypothetical protein